jgi:sugar phosphate isomerase/epimerase
MLTAVATWPFVTREMPLAQRVEQFADLGFEGVSMLPRQLLDLSEAEAGELVRVLDARSLCATVHGDAGLQPDQVARLLDTLGDRLRCLTIDRAYREDSRGRFYDAEGMAATLGTVASLCAGKELYVAVEDFPLDEAAVAHYRGALEPLLASPRYGILIDVGHLNWRRHRTHYFADLSVGEYIARVPLPIVEVHLHDNDGTRDAHAPLGEGNVDFGEVAAALKTVGFDGVATVEIAPGLHGASPDEELPRLVEAAAIWRGLWG